AGTEPAGSVVPRFRRSIARAQLLALLAPDVVAAAVQPELDAGGQRDLELDLARRDGVAARRAMRADPAPRPDLAGLLARHLAGLDHSAHTGAHADVFHAPAAGRLA